jgi:hypothetical protein
MVRIPSCTWLILIAVVTTARAAPTTGAGDGASQEADATDVAGSRTAVLPETISGSDGQGTSRTIRMLLELQGAPPPLEGQTDARRRERLAATKLLRAASPGPVLAPGSGSVSVGIDASTPAPAPDSAEIVAAGKVDWRAGLPGRTADVGITPASLHEAGYGSGVGRPGRPGSNPDDMDAVKAMLPAKLLALLREYREWLLAGGLVVLTVLGLSASAMSQRRR